MKKINKILNILIIISIIVLSIGSINVIVYAENEVKNINANTNTNAQQINTTSSNTISNNKTTNGKSSNTNLSNLGITPNDFKGFKPQTTTYNVTVPKDLESITIYATAQSSKATISGIGKKNLGEGTNKFEIIVTAENGATKTYILNITKSENTKNTENVQEKYTGDGLASLNIENVELSPKFDTIVYEYSVEYIGEDTKLNINATTTDPYYDIEITGNENLVEGENIINILVTDPDGNNVAVYQINVNKSLVNEEINNKEDKKDQVKKIIIGIIIAALIITIIIVIIKIKRNKEWEYDEEDHLHENTANNKISKNNHKKIDNSEGENLTKEQAREKFLNNYNNNYEEIDNNIDKIKKKKSKGKRFK